MTTKTQTVYILSLDNRPLVAASSLLKLHKSIEEEIKKATPFRNIQGAPSYPAISAALRDPQLGVFIRTVYLDGAYTGLIKISRIELI